jgi:hypothetical protein
MMIFLLHCQELNYHLPEICTKKFQMKFIKTSILDKTISSLSPRNVKFKHPEQNLNKKIRTVSILYFMIIQVYHPQEIQVKRYAQISKTEDQKK